MVVALDHSGGQLKQFSYGNGITFSQLLNTRGLPDRRSDKYGSSITLDYQYDYDQNGNLVALSDALGRDLDESMQQDAQLKRAA